MCRCLTPATTAGSAANNSSIQIGKGRSSKGNMPSSAMGAAPPSRDDKNIPNPIRSPHRGYFHATVYPYGSSASERDVLTATVRSGHRSRT
jgi:hypothetical protein